MNFFVCLSLLTCICLQHETSDNSSAVATLSSQPAAKRLVVSPVAVQQPLMKERLFPDEFDRRDGDAAPILLRMAWENTSFFANVVPKYPESLALSLDDPNIEKTRDLLPDRLYSEMRRASLKRQATWEYPIHEEPLTGILLPDLQGARDLVGRGLSIRIRYHIARGELQEAREAIQVGFGVTSHYARTPFAVTQLVVKAINGLMLDRVEELICAKDSANLYWALTSLQRPTALLKSTTDFEQHFLESIFPELEHVLQSGTSDDWDRLKTKCLEEYHLFWPPSTDSQLYSATHFNKLVYHARRALPSMIPDGEAVVSQMEDSEVGMRWLILRNERDAASVSANMSLEPHLAIPRLAKLQDEFVTFRKETGVQFSLVAGNPLDLYLTLWSQDRRIDALRVVEGVRNYAATHDGALPESLDQVTETPLPLDPFTGRPFQYAVQDGIATISTPALSNEEPLSQTLKEAQNKNSFVYEISIR